MTNETPQPRELAGRLAATAQALADAVRLAPVPHDAARILGDLVAAQASLVQVYAELADWHRTTAEPASIGTGANARLRPEASAFERTRARLEAAAQRAELVEMWLEAALSSSGEARWTTLPVVVLHTAPRA